MADRGTSLGDRVVREAIRRGARKGIGEGSRVWMVVGATAVGVRLLQRFSRRKPTVFTQPLAPGETIVISHLAPEGGPDR